jgi:ABC-type phosphate transport system substrate-binding protein
MFSGTDSLVSESDKTAINALLTPASPAGSDYQGRDTWTQIPMTAAPIAVIVNLPGVTANIKLDGATLCKIYTGDIRVWNHADILALNPTIKALRTMTQTIKPVARLQTSGTTFIFVSFLATAAGVVNNCSYNTNWADTDTSLTTHSGDLAPKDAVMSTRFAAMRQAKAAAASETYTAIATGDGNLGVKNAVNSTPYAIGYVEMSYSYASNIRQAAIATKDKTGSPLAPKYLLPSVSGATAALTAQNNLATAIGSSDAVKAANNPVNPSASYVQPVNQAGLTTYPIVGYSWVLLYKQFLSSVATAPSKGQVEGLIYFLNWSLTKGAVYTSETTKCFSPLPSTVKAAVIAELKKVKYNNGTTNVTVWR